MPPRSPQLNARVDYHRGNAAPGAGLLRKDPSGEDQDPQWRPLHPFGWALARPFQPFQPLRMLRMLRIKGP